MSLKWAIGIRYCVSTKDFIVCKLKVVSEIHLHVRSLTARVILVSFLCVHRLFPNDILAILMPAELRLLILLFAPEWRLHSLLKKTITFCEVHNVQTNIPGHCVLHSKHEPVNLILSIGIITHPDVEHACISLPDLVNISTFEITVEDDCLGEPRLDNHLGLQHHFQFSFFFLLRIRFLFSFIFLLELFASDQLWHMFGQTWQQIVLFTFQD